MNRDSKQHLDWIELRDTKLDTAEAVRSVTDASAGGIAVFLGTTRAELAPAEGTQEPSPTPLPEYREREPIGAPLVALDYEAYAEMAIEQMRDLARRARQKWPIIRLALLHRTGRVNLGDPSVIIAVSTPHRAEAFEACKWLIDTLKSEVAIWKKEIWSDGATSWVDPQQSRD